jgi:hypothetical protein
MAIAVYSSTDPRKGLGVWGSSVYRIFMKFLIGGDNIQEMLSFMKIGTGRATIFKGGKLIF